MWVEWDPFRQKWCVKVKALFITTTLFSGDTEDAAYDFLYAYGLNPKYENWRNGKDGTELKNTK